MFKTLLGLWLILDGFFSMVLVIDKHWKWQLARLVRIGIGVVVMVR